MNHVKMNVKMSYVKPLLFAATLALTSTAFAQYNADNDVYVRVDAPTVTKVAKKVELGKLGATLFEAQEGVHETVKETTDQEVEHYYIHVCSGDECVPVDPMRLSN